MQSVANPIGRVLSRFGVTIDGELPAGPTPTPTNTATPVPATSTPTPGGATPTSVPPTATSTPTATPAALACTAPVVSGTDTNPTGGGIVTLTWPPVAGATQYTVQRQKIDGTWSTRQTSSATSFTGSDHPTDPFWRLFVSAGSCTPIPGPATTFDPPTP